MEKQGNSANSRIFSEGLGTRSQGLGARGQQTEISRYRKRRYTMYADTDRLIVWQQSHHLVLKIYEITKGFPKEELFGLTSQIRRAAVSIPSNIVEGRARGFSKEYKRFLLMARGSLEEVKYQLLLARDLKYIEDEKYKEIFNAADEVGRLLSGLIKRVGQ